MKYVDPRAQCRAQCAAGTLMHYVNRVFASNGLRWDTDNAAEIHGVVDAIVEAAVVEVMARLRAAGAGE